MEWYWIVLITVAYLLIGILFCGVITPSKRMSALKLLFLWPLLLVGIVLQLLVYGIDWILFGKKEEENKIIEENEKDEDSSDSAAQ